MAGPLHFYFDFVSPYGWIAAEQIGAIAKRFDRSVEWHPILLGVTVLDRMGLPPPLETPLKGPYLRHDIQRCLRFHGMRLAAHARFGFSSLAAGRAVCWVRETRPDLTAGLMHGVNGRGTYLVTQKCLPHLLAATNPHVIAISPPLVMEERWFAPHVAYSMAKYAMSMVILGVAGEFSGRIGVNALWPRTAIATAAMAEFKPAAGGQPLRSPEIMADAAHLVLGLDARTTTGNFFIDDELLAMHGMTDLSGYAPTGVADIDILPDFFVPSLRELQGLPD